MFGFTSPTSYRIARAVSDYNCNPSNFVSMSSDSPFANGALDMITAASKHSSHPDFGHLVLLVFEAVLEVVCVSLPGYIVARQGMFDADAQKFVANLNVQLFTPCLIFTKLASQLTAEKLVELAVIPFIFVVQTIVSYLCALGMSKLFRFKKRPQNFVIAMGVFGNSNSLPISLVISLSKTLKGLHWDRIPGDNDDEVAARGILYLLIFQQLGQLVRWSWGYHVLLAPADKYKDEDEGRNSRLERGTYRTDRDDGSEEHLIEGVSDDEEEGHGQIPNGKHSHPSSSYVSGSTTPVNGGRNASSVATSSASSVRENPNVLPTPADGNVVGRGAGNMAGHRESYQESQDHITTFPDSESLPSDDDSDMPPGFKGQMVRAKRSTLKAWKAASTRISRTSRKAFTSLPQSVQKVLSRTWAYFVRFLYGLWEFMNPPLWAMLAAIIVASVPYLQHLFFDPGTFINNSVTRAVAQSGGVAVPLILVVLGANLARNTLPREDVTTDDPKLEKKLLIASLVSRMLLPTLLMAPLLALTAKFVPVSILDDPIFVIVCFLLTGAPSALQLAQICQINNVYMGAMARLLFQSYVVWILPSTLILVMLALEVVEWAQA